MHDKCKECAKNDGKTHTHPCGCNTLDCDDTTGFPEFEQKKEHDYRHHECERCTVVDRGWQFGHIPPGCFCKFDNDAQEKANASLYPEPCTFKCPDFVEKEEEKKEEEKKEDTINKNVRCVNCANTRDMPLLTSSPPYCYCTAGVFAGRVNIVTERDCNKFVEKKPEPVLVKCRDCANKTDIDTVRNYCGCTYYNFNAYLMDDDHPCPRFVKENPVKEETELVKCRDCQDCQHYTNILDDYFKCGVNSLHFNPTDMDNGNLPCFVKKEPVLVKCRDCQHAQEIYKSIDEYMCICTERGGIINKVLNENRTCPSFVEKTCEGCKHDGKQVNGCCDAYVQEKPRLVPQYRCNAPQQPELGRYAWESGELGTEKTGTSHPTPLEEPEKEKEKQIEWNWVAPCTDCEYWTDDKEIRYHHGKPWMPCKLGTGYAIRDSCEQSFRRPCSEYKKKWAWEAPNKCDGCKFWTENGKIMDSIEEGEKYMGCLCNPTIAIKHTLPNFVKGPTGKECPYHGESWEWEADCGDCMNREYIYDDNGNKKCNRAFGTTHVFVKHGSLKGATWYRIQHPDFHDCEGYTPEDTGPEKDIPENILINEYEKSCDNCSKESCNEGLRKWWCWMPRSCENCANLMDSDIVTGGKYCKIADTTMCVECKTWRSWIPKKEEKKEPAKSCEKSCENCGCHDKYGCWSTGMCVEKSQWRAEKPEDPVMIDLVKSDPVKSCETCGNYRLNKCTSDSYIECAGKHTWRSWTPRTEKREKEHVPYWKQSNIIVSERVTYQCPCGNVINIEAVEKKEENIKEIEEVIEMNEKEKEDWKKRQEEYDKREKKFPFTCPECESDEFIPGHAVYCPFCGHEFGTRMEETVLEVDLPDKRSGKTRKAVRVREMRKPAFILGISLLIFDISVGIFSLVIGFWPNTIYMFAVSIFVMIGLSDVIELVDVPRVTVMDRFRAWKDKRVDNRIREKNDYISELRDKLHRANEKIELIESHEECLEEIIDDWKQTAANLTKLHEEEKTNLITAREAEVAAHMRDRDENWIPRSNRINAGIGQVDTREDIVTGLYAFIIGGVLKEGVLPRKDKLLLFSADVIKEDSGDGDT